MGSHTAKLLKYDPERPRPEKPLMEKREEAERGDVPMDPDLIARKYWRDSERTFYLIKGVLSPELHEVLVANMEQLQKKYEVRRFQKATSVAR